MKKQDITKMIKEELKNLTEQDLINRIEDIISSEIYLRDVPYSMQEGDMEMDPKSVLSASEMIVNMLKNQGII